MAEHSDLIPVIMTIEESLLVYAAAIGNAEAFSACRPELLQRVRAPLPLMSYRAWVEWLSMQGTIFKEAE